VIYSERIHLADSENTDHFENIQSTNWQTVRWKPPPPNSDIGWRVEFRSMEAQLTDFENAAYTILTVLLSRVLLYFRLNLYIPLSKVDENMATAHKRNAVIEQKFWFRKHMAHDVPPDAEEYELMTISEILTGTDSQKLSPKSLSIVNVPGR
jgi:glutamate--cysteine ligase catalytic subunit